MDRDEFVKAIIGELSRQKELDIDTFERPKEKTPKEVFHKLCYDFPEVCEKEISDLGNAIFLFVESSISRDKKVDEFFENEFHLHHKFMENIIFFSSNINNKTTMSTIEADTPRSCDPYLPGVTCLNCAVYLSLPLAMLSFRQHQLVRMLPSFESPYEEDDFKTVKENSSSLDWANAIDRFEQLILSSSPSVILGGGIDNGTILRQHCFRSLLETIALLNPESQEEIDGRNVFGSNSSLTLLEALKLSEPVFIVRR